MGGGGDDTQLKHLGSVDSFLTLAEMAPFNMGQLWGQGQTWLAASCSSG